MSLPCPQPLSIAASVSSFLCFHSIVGQGGQDPLPPALLMLLPRRGDSRRGTD